MGNPGYAAWDLGFHVIALSLVDSDFGKQQLSLLLKEHYMHPNGQLPAYEWNFGDVNPPVHAWATIFAYRLDKMQTGVGDTEWLKGCFHKLVLNFNWWVNRVDHTGRNVFEGGFLGLDNISAFDRSAPLPNGGHLEQADGTAWMTLFSQNMAEIAAELSMSDPSYVDMTLKFVEHFMWIASAMNHLGEGTGMWDEEDGFFYDLLRLPDGGAQRLKVRSMVGLLPLCAATTLEAEQCEKFPAIQERFAWFLDARPELTRVDARSEAGWRRRPAPDVHPERRQAPPCAGDDARRERVSQPVRSALHLAVSRGASVCHLCGRSSEPGCLSARRIRQRTVRRQLELARPDLDADERADHPGPHAVPRILRRRVHDRVPNRLGRQMNLRQVAEEISRRLTAIFVRDAGGRRPVYGSTQKFQEDPHWRDCLSFHEYFHGDNGAGLGASHQTGWTGVIARLVHLFAPPTTVPEVRGKTTARRR